MSSLVPACAGASGCLAPGKCAAAGRRASFCGLSEQTRGRLGRGPRRLWGGGEAGGVQGPLPEEAPLRRRQTLRLPEVSGESRPAWRRAV